MHTSRLCAIALVASLALEACGSGDLLLPNAGQPADLTPVSGNDQTGTILEPAGDSLVVRVQDRFGNPVPGVEVQWQAQDGGEVQPATTVTGGDGRAAAERVLGAQPGDYRTTAIAPALPGDVVTFTTTAVAAKIVLTTQPAATAASGAVLDPQPVTELQDPAGAPLARSGVVVSVQIASGGGTLLGTTSLETDGAGHAAFTDLAISGGPGARTLIFAASGYAPATSTPVALGIGAPASVEISAGNGQSARVGTAVAVAPAVLVRDAAGTPVPGVAVRFTVTSGGGSVAGGNATTDADGVAAVGRWTLGDKPGTNTLRAAVSADGVNGNPVSFTATATPGPASAGKSSVSASPSTITASSGSSASTITVVVRDALGNPIPGQSVTLSASGDGVTLSQPGPTGADGKTTASFSATAAGQHTISAVSSGVSLGSATVTVTAAAPLLAATTVQVPAGTAGTVSQIVVRLEDQFGNPVPGAASQLSVRITGANSPGTVKVAAQEPGVYVASYTPTRTGTDQVEVRLGGAAVPGSPFATTVIAGPADPTQTTAEVPAGQLFVPDTITVHVKDAFGNPLGRGGDQVRISVKVTELTVTDAGDGTYFGVYLSLVSANDLPVAITLNGTAIAGSPFKLRISGVF